MSRDRYKTLSVGPHFLTCTTVQWLPVFSDPDAAQIVFDTLTYLQDNDRLSLFGYVLMENHIHLIASSNDLTANIGVFKSYSARKIIDMLIEKKRSSLLEQLHFYKEAFKSDREYQLWQEGSHPEIIMGYEMMNQKLTYMHYNPVRRGYVADPVHWRYSSACCFAGKDGLLPLNGWKKK